MCLTLTFNARKCMKVGRHVQAIATAEALEPVLDSDAKRRNAAIADRISSFVWVHKSYVFLLIFG